VEMLSILTLRLITKLLFNLPVGRQVEEGYFRDANKVLEIQQIFV